MKLKVYFIVETIKVVRPDILNLFPKFYKFLTFSNRVRNDWSELYPKELKFFNNIKNKGLY